MKMQRVLLWLVCSSIFLGCAFGKSISDEEPYRGMIGECYETKVDMAVYENVCWESGDLMISHRASEFCFRSKIVPLLPKGSVLFIKDISKQGFGESGPCFNIEVTSPVVHFENRKLNIPVCSSRDYLSWLKNKYASIGEKIELNEAFVASCKSKPSHIGE